jgi:glycosyltransferase involved in cell wall biosynthesis
MSPWRSSAGLLTNELRRPRSELGIDGRVRFVGRVAEDELLDWYRAADLFVLPTVACEGFGMVTVEALASERRSSGHPRVRRPSCSNPWTDASLPGARTLNRWRLRFERPWLSSTTISGRVVAGTRWPASTGTRSRELGRRPSLRRC